MKNRYKIERFSEWLVYLAGALLTAFWFMRTGAHVNEEALHTLYLPFLRSLQLLEHFSFNALELIKETHHGPYPYGIYILPISFHLLGLGKLLLQQPFWLCAFLSLCFSFATFVGFKNSRQSLRLFLLIFCFPLFQISLKSFSPHAWNVLYGFLMVVLFERFEQDGKRKYLFASLISAIFCVACKHFGIVIVSLYFICKIAAALCCREAYRQYLPMLLAALFCGALFYPGTGLWSYIQVMFRHNPRFNYSDALIVIILFVALFVLLIWFFRRNSWRLSGKMLAGRGLFIVLQLLFFVFYMNLNNSVFDADLIHFYAFFVVFCVTSLLSFIFIPLKSLGLYGFFYATLGAAWFFFLFAYHIDFFVFPFLILFYLSIKEGLSRLSFILLLVGGFLLSNMFSDFSGLMAKTGLSIFRYSIKERIFNSYTWKPLSWQPMRIDELRREIQCVVRPVITDWPFFPLAAHMELQTQTELNWPPYMFIDNVPGFVENAKLEFKQNGVEQTFLRWHEEKRVLLFMVPFPDSSIHIRADAAYSLKKLEAYFAGEELNDGMGFVGMVGDAWWDFVQKKGLLSDYERFDLPHREPFLRVYRRIGVKKNSFYTEDSFEFSSEPVIMRLLKAHDY